MANSNHTKEEADDILNKLCEAHNLIREAMIALPKEDTAHKQELIGISYGLGDQLRKLRTVLFDHLKKMNEAE